MWSFEGRLFTAAKQVRLMDDAQESTDRVIIVSQYSFPENKRNMNAYQRVLYGARHAAVTLLVRREAQVSQELTEAARVIRAPFQNRWFFLTYSAFFMVALRCRGRHALLTEPSGFAAIGFFAKYLLGYKWALDVWDRPRWRTGEHEDEKRRRFSDRFVFWLMRHADVYLLSVLPRAAKDIAPNPTRCIQLFNGIDRSIIANEPLRRDRGADATLHLAYGRSKFWETQGLEVLIEAANILKRDGCPIRIHIIGELPPNQREQIENSYSASLFTIHGFLESGCVPLYRQVHAGVIPYPPYEDLSYIMPIKVLEHLSQGNPVIASRLPGICTMVKHELNGLLVTPGDSNDLANAIARLQADRELFNRLSSNALNSVKQFDVETKNREIFKAILGQQTDGASLHQARSS
jgi:glycosyltransferase involved in cell wall biosynthesis